MNWWTAAPTMGSCAIGIGLLLGILAEWWPGLEAFQGSKGKGRGKSGIKDAVLSILPLVFAYCYGMLVILGVGGLIGWAANATLWGIGWVGDGALIWGVGGTRANAGLNGQRMTLTNGGLMFMLVATFVVLAVRRRPKTSDWTRKCISRGILCGILTGTVAGISSAAAVPLASVANAAGQWFPGSGT